MPAAAGISTACWQQSMPCYVSIRSCLGGGHTQDRNRSTETEKHEMPACSCLLCHAALLQLPSASLPPCPTMAMPEPATPCHLPMPCWLHAMPAMAHVMEHTKPPAHALPCCFSLPCHVCCLFTHSSALCSFSLFHTVITESSVLKSCYICWHACSCLSCYMPCHYTCICCSLMRQMSMLTVVTGT